MINDGKILSIQYLRGLAALEVVFCHFSFGLTYYPKLSKILYFGLSGVYVFFLISGFIIVYSLMKSNYHPSQFFRFLLKRLLRIDPSYWATIFLTLLLFKILTAIHFKGDPMPFVSGQFIAHIFYFVPFTNYPFYSHVLWTLGVEFQFYLIIGLVYFISDSVIYKVMFLLLFSFTCLIPFSNDYTVFHFAPFFAMGISLVMYHQKKALLNLLIPGLCLMLVVYKFGYPVALLILISSSLIFLFTADIKPLKFFGDISYSLYLTHPLVSIVLFGTAKRVNLNPDQYQLLWLSFLFCVAIGVAYIFYIFIEKPSLKLSKKISYGNNLRISQSINSLQANGKDLSSQTVNQMVIAEDGGAVTLQIT